VLGQFGGRIVVRLLQNELVDRGVWPTLARLRTATFDYIEIFYNRQRRHSSLGNLSPAHYELTRRTVSTQAA
jgi:putative transposase